MKNLYISYIMLIMLLLTACSSQIYQENEYRHFHESYMPVTFTNELELAEKISEITSVNESSMSSYNAFTISQNRENLEYVDVVADVHDLSSITEIFRPRKLMKGMIFSSIVVKKEYVNYQYIYANNEVVANFTWFREMSPEVAMNGLYGRGAIIEREAEHNGIRYIILGWPDESSEKIHSYSIRWVQDGKPFGVWILGEHSDEEIFAFCDFERVSIKDHIESYDENPLLSDSDLDNVCVKIGHLYIRAVNATCSKGNFDTNVCSRCEAVETDTNDKPIRYSWNSALGHNYEVIKTTVASCLSGGGEYVKCKRCGYETIVNWYKALGHSFGQPQSTDNPRWNIVYCEREGCDHSKYRLRT